MSASIAIETSCCQALLLHRPLVWANFLLRSQPGPARTSLHDPQGPFTYSALHRVLRLSWRFLRALVSTVRSGLRQQNRTTQLRTKSSTGLLFAASFGGRVSHALRHFRTRSAAHKSIARQICHRRAQHSAGGFQLACAALAQWLGRLASGLPGRGPQWTTAARLSPLLVQVGQTERRLPGRFLLVQLWRTMGHRQVRFQDARPVRRLVPQGFLCLVAGASGTAGQKLSCVKLSHGIQSGLPMLTVLVHPPGSGQKQAWKCNTFVSPACAVGQAQIAHPHFT